MRASNKIFEVTTEPIKINVKDNTATISVENIDRIKITSRFNKQMSAVENLYQDNRNTFVYFFSSILCAIDYAELQKASINYFLFNFPDGIDKPNISKTLTTNFVPMQIVKIQNGFKLEALVDNDWKRIALMKFGKTKYVDYGETHEWTVKIYGVEYNFHLKETYLLKDVEHLQETLKQIFYITMPEKLVDALNAYAMAKLMKGE